MTRTVRNWVITLIVVGFLLVLLAVLWAGTVSNEEAAAILL